jgi:hypothetical protein
MSYRQHAIALIDRLFGHIKHRVVGKQRWNFQSYLRWHSGEYNDTRPYIPWDSIRTINRKKTATLWSLYTTIFDHANALRIDIFLDININWKGTFHQSWRQSVMQLITQCREVTRRHGREIVCHFPDKSYIIIKNRWDLLNLENILTKKIMDTPLVYQSHLQQFCEIIKNLKKQQGIVIISDFCDWDDWLEQRYRLFSMKHICLFARLWLPPYWGRNYRFDHTTINLPTANTLQLF